MKVVGPFLKLLYRDYIFQVSPGFSYNPSSLGVAHGIFVILEKL